jgi:hypothetical protein
MKSADKTPACILLRDRYEHSLKVLERIAEWVSYDHQFEWCRPTTKVVFSEPLVRNVHKLWIEACLL